MDENGKKNEEREDVTIINIGADEKKTEEKTQEKAEEKTYLTETGKKTEFSEEFSAAAKKAGDALGTGIRKTGEFMKDLGSRTEGLRHSLKEKGFEVSSIT